ncbi:MAG TPA: hypothetical protein VFH56_12155 [Acidimicrobiales bacterium]|nr:hypothetical protein [Acidimicrobiales bacterium]
MNVRFLWKHRHADRDGEHAWHAEASSARARDTTPALASFDHCSGGAPPAIVKLEDPDAQAAVVVEETIHGCLSILTSLVLGEKVSSIEKNYRVHGSSEGSTA